MATSIYVASSGINGTSWYKKYSNGWVEQGGEASGYGTTVTLWQPMKNTNYTVVSGKYRSSNNNSSATPNIYSKTTTSFTLCGRGQGGSGYEEDVPINYTVYGWGG